MFWWWWEQEGLYIEGAKEIAAADSDGEEEKCGEGMEKEETPDQD